MKKSTIIIIIVIIVVSISFFFFINSRRMFTVNIRKSDEIRIRDGAFRNSVIIDNEDEINNIIALLDVIKLNKSIDQRERVGFGYLLTILNNGKIVKNISILNSNYCSFDGKLYVCGFKNLDELIGVIDAYLEGDENEK